MRIIGSWIYNISIDYMPFIETSIPDLKIFDPKVFGDHRGYFMESYNKRTFEAAGINCEFVQDNRRLIPLNRDHGFIGNGAWSIGNEGGYGGAGGADAGLLH